MDLSTVQNSAHWRPEPRIDASFAVPDRTILATDAVNEAYSTITGYSQDEVIGKKPNILSSGRQKKSFYKSMWNILLQDGFWQGEMWNRRKNGEIYPQWLSISTVLDNQQKPVRYIGVFSDISVQKKSQSQLEFLAHHDPLTQLFNRSAVETRMEQELELARRHDQQLSVLFIDLDRFKQVNDSFGHLIGDELLCSVAGRLKLRLRDGDTLGRWVVTNSSCWPRHCRKSMMPP